jgi:hypothetical protein
VAPLLEITHDPNPERWPDALEVLGRVLQNQRLGICRYPLTNQAVRETETRIRAGLRDPLPYVRWGAIEGVKAAGDVASLPVLEQLSTSDPYTAPNTTKYLIREEAEAAIMAIKAHPLGKRDAP